MLRQPVSILFWVLQVAADQGQQGKTVQDIERTVCWGHLETLNRCLPTRYKSPSYLLALIRRDLENPKED